MATVKIEGLNALTETLLKELPESVGRASIQRTLKKRAQPFAEKWRGMVPRDEGHYAASIIVGPNSRLTSRQKKDGRKEGKRFAEIHVGTSDPAGQQQEFGNVNHPPQPSGRPAWEASQPGMIEGIGQDFAADLEKTAARRARKLAKG